ncbi:MAG: FAD-binding protein [Gammaproteobacteria bacterium]|nr:FAD-binding protein [Gammaproteobacteria bacterium]
MDHNEDTIDPSAPIEIAGAGPAGLAAAITLATAGRRVIVHEAHQEVGQRFDGDFQGIENWTTEEDALATLSTAGLTTAFTAKPYCQGSAFDASGKRYEIKTNEPLFYLVERGPGPDTLDSALLQQAQELGVEVRFNSRLQHIAGAGILASGPHAADAIAVGYHFDTDIEDGFWVICDDNLAPQGYAYLLIMGGKGTVKSCMFSDFKQEKIYVQRTIEAFQKLTGLDMHNPRPHGGSGNFVIPDSAYGGIHPIVGEQAGFQDTLWGFGMRLAISSGVLAAQSLLNHENYDRLWQQQLKPQMETSIVNRAMFSLLGNRGYRWFLRNQASNPDLRTSLRHQYRGSFFKRLLLPLARLRYQSQRKNVSCNHVDCQCVWCRSQRCSHG